MFEHGVVLGNPPKFMNPDHVQPPIASHVHNSLQSCLKCHMVP